MSTLEQTNPSRRRTPDGLYVPGGLFANQRTLGADLFILRTGVNWDRCRLNAHPSWCGWDLVVLGHPDPLELFYGFFWSRCEITHMNGQSPLTNPSYYDGRWQSALRPKAPYSLRHTLVDDQVHSHTCIAPYRQQLRDMGYDELVYDSVMPSFKVSAAAFFGIM